MMAAKKKPQTYHATTFDLWFNAKMSQLFHDHPSVRQKRKRKEKQNGKSS